MEITEILEYLSILGFIVGAIMLINVNSIKTVYDGGMVMGGLAVISASTPGIGFLLSRLIYDKKFESQRLYMILVSINLMISSGFLYSITSFEGILDTVRIITIVATLLVGLIPVLGGVFE